MSIKNDYDIPNYGEIKGIVGKIFHGERHDDYDFTKLVVLGGGESRNKKYNRLCDR